MQTASSPVVEAVAVAPVQRQIQLGFRESERAGEIGRCHADDRAGVTVHHDGPADRRRIAAESALPGRVSKYNYRIGSARRPLVGSYDASKNRANVERRKVVARNLGDEDAFGLASDRGKAEESDAVPAMSSKKSTVAGR